MKRSFAIILIVILLLNVLGYYGAFLGMHYSNDLAMTKALDSDDYERSQAVTIKLAMSIPYMPDQTEFTRVEGDFEHEGELYRMVKQRYARDTLTIICVKDPKHKKINDALADYVKAFTDKTDNKATTKISINFLKEYLPATFSICSSSHGWATDVMHSSRCRTMIPTFIASIIHPPERA